MSFRKAHLLQTTSGGDRPNRVVFVDTETYQETLEDGEIRHYLRLGYAQFCRTRRDDTLRFQSDYEIYDTLGYWNWIESLVPPKTKLYMVSHNCNYDIPVLHSFKHLSDLGWSLNSWYQKGMSGIFEWEKDKRKIIWLDNGNFFQGKLKTWGKTLGLDKLEVDFDGADNVELMVYCKRDVQIMVELWRIWFQFLDDNDLGSFRYTVSSTAFNAFRYRFMKHHIMIHDNEKANSLERQAYRGGRVDCLYVGTLTNSKFYYADVNNMYGFVMANNPYPKDLLHYSEGCTLETLERKLNTYAVVAEVTLNTTSNPFHYKTSERIIYPTGLFRSTLTTPELRYALDCGWITKIHKIAVYSQAYLFKEYIEYFYDIRRQYQRNGQDGMAKIAKLFNNGLYGKFGQLALTSTIVGTCEPDITKIVYNKDLPTGRYGELVWLGGNIFYVEKSGEAHNSFPAIAAHVTSYARMHLFKLVSSIPKYHAYYMDTDSIVTDDIGLASLSSHLDEHRLGALKIECESTWLTIRAPKDYAMEGRSRIKGVNSSAVQLDTNRFEQMQWRRLTGLIAKGTVEDYRSYMITKELKRTVNSGVHQLSGWVEPFHFSDFPE